MNKLQQLMNDAGVCPDGDLVEFDEMVLEECFKLLAPTQVELIKNHFGLK